MLTAKIEIISDNSESIRKTLVLFIEICNYISTIAYDEKCFNWMRLRYRMYYECRKKFPDVPSKSIVMAVRRVARAYTKYGRDNIIQFKSISATFTPCQFRLDLEHSLISVLLVGGRQKLNFRTGERQREILKGKWREATLYENKGKFFFNIACDVDKPEPYKPKEVLGCDLGIANILADSDGEVYSGINVDEKRRIFSHRRRNLQRKQTRSATRKLVKISGYQANYQKDVNHCISKRIVTKARDTERAIAIEDLTGIHNRVTVRRQQRSQHSNWGFYQLRTFIEYKASLAGVPVIVIDPKYTSQRCSQCGHTERANRRSQSEFICKSCGFAALADTNASQNIRLRALSDVPMVTGHA